MDSPSDTSFVRQSLSDTLSATARPSKAPLRSAHTVAQPPSTVRHVRTGSAAAPQTAKKQHGDEEADSLLRRLGLAGGASGSADGSTMEDASFAEAFETPKAKPRRPPAGPTEFLPPVSSIPAVAAGVEVERLKAQLAKVEQERDGLVKRCGELEEELKRAVKRKDEGADGKVLGAAEYEELERHFDAQEKLLSGYQRENERSLIELNAQKRRMDLMSAALVKAYGHDWESSLGISSSSPGPSNGPANASKRLSLNLSSPPISPDPTPSPSSAQASASPEKVTVGGGGVTQAQLEMVHDLIRGMERRLIQSEGELLGLKKEAREEGGKVFKAVEGIRELVAVRA